MTTDLWMLLATAALQWVLIVIPTVPKILGNGMAWAAGNRMDGGKPLTPIQSRMARAGANLAENLPIFAVLILVAHVTGVANETTALGATIFLYARAAHALVYIAGVPFLRTGVWGVSIAGMVMIATAFFA